LAGRATVTTATDFWGAEANGRINVGGNGSYRVDCLVGFRYAQIDDDLNITGVAFGRPPFGLLIGPATPVQPPGTSVTMTDVFNTCNQFYGGQVGVRAEFYRGPWFVSFQGKLALGVMHQEVEIDGRTTLVRPTGTLEVPGGIFALPTNMGRYSRNEFGVAPEGGINIGCQLTSWLRAQAGYSVLYFRSNVVRPGDQIDRVLNVTQIPLFDNGPLRGDRQPAFGFRDTDFWAQGLNAGIELNF
jgi:hypothetical protein